MVRINWTHHALGDLKEIAAYIGKDSKVYARRQIERIKKRTQILKTNPFAGQLVDFFEDRSLRQLTEGSYIIIYRVVDMQRIDILTVHHSSRDLGKRNLKF